MSLVLDGLTSTNANLALAAIRIADALLSVRRFLPVNYPETGRYNRIGMITERY